MAARKESDYLHSGDPVWWKDGRGTNDARMAEVTLIEVEIDPWTNSGPCQKKRLWKRLDNDRHVVRLANGHWAYGYQIHPVEIWRRTYEQDE